MSSKPTLRDIAEATGVSTASVSMILNGKSLERFSSQRVASVLAEAERIGYRTPSARCAGKQITILSPSVSNPYHTMMISGIDAAASAAGYQTAIYNPCGLLSCRGMCRHRIGAVRLPGRFDGRKERRRAAARLRCFCYFAAASLRPLL